MLTQPQALLATVFLLLEPIIGSKKTGLPTFLPVSRSTLNSVKPSIYPVTIKISQRLNEGKVDNIRNLLNALGNVRVEKITLDGGYPWPS